MRPRVLPLLGLLALAPAGFAATVAQSRLSTSVDEQTCAAPRAVTSFLPTQRQIFLWFVARQVRPGDRLRVDWVDPSGAISTSAQYEDLPSASELCLITQLPVAGFAPASQPGQWTARIAVGDRVLASQRFQIIGDNSVGGPQVTSVIWPGAQAAETDFTVNGSGFLTGATVIIAQSTSSDDWVTLSTVTPRSLAPDRIVAHYAGLPAAEYLVIVQNPDGRMSRPMPFAVATQGYKLPFAGGESWVLTQGPHGSFSHWGNSLYAYDIAPVTSRCVVAMRAGIAYTHDLGLQQDHRHRSFGNYITIDHGDGEYSHYAHLATGTFVVANGQRVEQGQALATVGNSGYTLGEGGGYHVHVHVTRAEPIASQSVPFEFEDLPVTSHLTMPRAIVSSNRSALCDCGSARPGRAETAVASNARPAAAAPKQFTGSLSVEEWWSDIVSVRKGARLFTVSVEWKNKDAALDLHLVSPSGRHYAWYGDSTGYSGQNSNPQAFRVPQPEPGLWRISVQAVKGGFDPIEFDVSSSGARVTASNAGTPAVGGGALH